MNVKSINGLQASIPRLIFSFFSNYIIDELNDSIIVDAQLKSFENIKSLLRLEGLEDTCNVDEKTLIEDASILGLSEVSIMKLKTLSNLSSGKPIIKLKSDENNLVVTDTIPPDQNCSSYVSSKIDSMPLEIDTSKVYSDVSRGANLNETEDNKCSKPKKVHVKAKKKKKKNKISSDGLFTRKRGDPIQKIEKNPITGRAVVVSLECRVCGQLFERKNHIQNGHKFRAYLDHWYMHEKCNCGINFTSKKARKRHILIVHQGKYPCDLEECKYVFNTENSMQIHMKKNHTQDLECDVPDCNFMTKTYDVLQRHNYRHKIPINQELKKSISIQKKEEDFSCHLCEGAVYRKRGLLNKHIKVVHGSKSCEVCGVIIKNEYRYAEHLMQKHNQGPEKQYQCDKCEKTFSNSYKLEHHLIVHSEEKFSCRFPNCETATQYNEPSNRNAHERKKHGLVYEKFLLSSIK